MYKVLERSVDEQGYDSWYEVEAGTLQECQDYLLLQKKHDKYLLVKVLEFEVTEEPF
jgi:hypothetical protein